MVKYAAIVVFSFAAAALVALVGSVIGLALFGGGEMILLSGTDGVVPRGGGRLLLSVAYVGCGLSALGAIGLFVSTLTEQPIGATVAVVLVNLMMIICDAVEQLSWLHPWLLTHWWTAFGDLLRDPIATAGIERGLATFGAYAVVFWLLAWARFTTKDVTS